MKHLSSISSQKPRVATLLEWEQKGVIFTTFAEGIALLAEAKATAEE